MESVGGNEGKKRRLPPWMMGAVGSNVVGEQNKGSLPKVKTRSRKVVKKSLPKDEETCATEEVYVPKTKMRSRKFVNESLEEDDKAHDLEEVDASKLKRRSKRSQKETLHEDEEANTVTSHVLVKCDAVKRKRKTSSEVEVSDMNNIGNEKLDQIAAPKKKKGNVNKLTLKEVSLSCTDSGRELLMEDLISIAEEYVKAESLTEQQQQTVVGSGPEEKFSAADLSFDESAPSFDGARAKCVSAITEVKSALLNSTEQEQNNNIFSSTSGTGDAAQDMLNLLLGPLLMKPVEESTTTLNLDDMHFDRPVRNHSQNHIVEELAPPMKKKTSLKDKVAMFFD